MLDVDASESVALLPILISPDYSGWRVLRLGFGDGPVIVGEILTDGANVVPLILLGICEAMAAYTTYLAFDKAGAARTLVFVNTYAIWSIPVGFILCCSGNLPVFCSAAHSNWYCCISDRSGSDCSKSKGTG